MGMHGSVFLNKTQHTLCVLENVGDMSDCVSYQIDRLQTWSKSLGRYLEFFEKESSVIVLLFIT